MAYTLKVISGPAAGQTLPLTPGTAHVIGRGADAHLCIAADQTLSRAHAEVYEQGGQWFIRNTSQHGTLMGGQVFQDQQPLTPGTQFQAGGSGFVFEMAPDAAPGGPIGGPVGGQVGAPVGGGAAVPAKVGVGAAAGLAGAKNFAAALGGDGAFALPAEYTGHSGPGFPFAALVKGGFGIVKANLVPSILLVLLCGIPLLNLISFVFIFNYLGQVKRFLETGQPITVGEYFKFDDVVQRLLLVICQGILSHPICIAGIPGMMTIFGMHIMVDKPGTPFVSALKASLFWTKSNLVGNLIQIFLLGLVLFCVIFLGMLACGVGIFVAMPTCMCAVFLAYQLKRAEIEAAAAENGVELV